MTTVCNDVKHLYNDSENQLLQDSANVLAALSLLSAESIYWTNSKDLVASMNQA